MDGSGATVAIIPFQIHKKLVRQFTGEALEHHLNRPFLLAAWLILA